MDRLECVFLGCVDVVCGASWVGCCLSRRLDECGVFGM